MVTTSMPGGGLTRVLILTNQQPLAQVVELTLSHGGYVTREVRDAVEAMPVIQEWQPLLAIIDAEVAYHQLLGQIGGAHGRPDTGLPVLALTRRSDLKTKLTAFEMGADDIMTVPFSPEELRARVAAISRRVYVWPLSLTTVLRLGELEIDILTHQVRVGHEVVHLTNREQSLLCLLAAKPGTVLTRDEILDAIWGADFAADSNLIDQHIRSLRVKLKDDSRHPRYIASVPGQGYRFILAA